MSSKKPKVLTDKEILDRARGETDYGFFSIFGLLKGYFFGEKKGIYKNISTAVRARQDELTTDNEIETKFERMK